MTGTAEVHIWHLKQCPLFTNLTTGELDAIYAASQNVSLGPGEIVPPPETGESALWIVKRGHVQLAYVDSTGREATVLILGPGDLFGGFHGHEDYGEHCKTLTSVCLCRLTQVRFEQLMQKYPDICHTITKASFDRIHRLQVRMAELMMRPVDQRIAITLLELDSQVGEECGEPEGRRLGLPLSHRDLSMLVGSSREMVTHVMRRLRKEGLVDTARKEIVITNVEKMRELAAR